jgi:hypothetical protein
MLPAMQQVAIRGMHRNQLCAEAPDSNWPGNKVEFSSFTVAMLPSQSCHPTARWPERTMILKIALSVLLVVVALLLFAATKPNSFRVQRSITIHASQEKVFSLINDLRSWDAWSEHNAGDGTVQKIYSGPASGVGAAAEWNGSGRAGTAKMLITESVAPSKVSVKVDWLKPFVAHNLNEFTIQAQGDETQVTWTIQASNLYAMKLMGIFFNIQSQFGQHMQSGLKNLKTAAEANEIRTQR